MTYPARWSVAIALAVVALVQALVGQPSAAPTRATTQVAAGATPPTTQASTAPVRVYPLGDSITFGGYRLVLTRALTAAGVEHLMVGASTANSTGLAEIGQAHHDGHSGYRIDQVAAGLDGRVARSDSGGYWLTGTASRAPLYPDVTVVHIGTNDITQRHDPGTRYPAVGGRADLADPAHRATFVGHAADRLQALIDKLQSMRPGSRVVLSNLVPIVSTPRDVTVEAYNARVAAIAAAESARGERVVLADVWSAFTARALLSPDGVHPTSAGYAVMGTVYRDAVIAALALP